MHANKANSLAARRLWFTTPPRSGSYAGKESANLRSLAGLRSAEPRSAASWPKRNPDSGRLTQPCRKDTLNRKPFIRIETSMFIGCLEDQHYFLGTTEEGIESAVRRMTRLCEEDRGCRNLGR